MLNVLIEMNYLAKRIVAMLPMMIRDIILLLMIIFGLSFGNIKGK
jgi:hypothetical protein